MLLEKVRPLIERQDTKLREAISAAERLAVTLRFLATDFPFPALRTVLYALLCFLLSNQDLVALLLTLARSRSLLLKITMLIRHKVTAMFYIYIKGPFSLSKFSIKNFIKENLDKEDLDKVSVVTIKVFRSSLSKNWREELEEIL
jgi:hypothetical protein